jgi:hypothetical protein
MGNGRIGVGIVTCKRKEMFKKCLASFPNSIEALLVVNDATPYNKIILLKKCHKTHTKSNTHSCRCQQKYIATLLYGK